jgi:hypothetical protein
MSAYVRVCAALLNYRRLRIEYPGAIRAEQRILVNGFFSRRGWHLHRN